MLHLPFATNTRLRLRLVDLLLCVFGGGTFRRSLLINIALER